MSFYLHLPSNVSPRYYPNNRMSLYKTKLPKRLNFISNEYEVAITEFTYVNSLKTFQQDDARKILFPNDPENNIGHRMVKNKQYQDVQSLVEEINLCLVLNDEVYASFAYNPETNRVHFLKGCGTFYINVCLANMLGFDLYTLDDTCRFDVSRIATNTPNLSRGIYHIFIYSDIIKRQIVGDCLCPLLRMVSVSSKKNEAVTHEFRPYYLPLSQLEFDTIEILLCDEFGDELQFEKGQCIVTLHFRKQQNGN